MFVQASFVGSKGDAALHQRFTPRSKGRVQRQFQLPAGRTPAARVSVEPWSRLKAAAERYLGQLQSDGFACPGPCHREGSCPW